MKHPEIDEEKLPEVMELVDAAANLLEKDYFGQDDRIVKELSSIEKRLEEITGRKIDRTEYHDYWSYTSLETVARKALMPEPEKIGLSDDQIRGIVLTITDYDEATMDYWLKLLQVNTGLDNLTDYIFWPDTVGLELDASMEAIADKIIADRS